MRSWDNKNGAPNRRSDFAHVCDAVSYPIYRFFARPKEKSKPATYTPLNRFGRARDLR